jgi:ubiquinone biosynthesis protein
MIWEALSAVRDLGRLHDIASILIRYGFGDVVSRAGLGHFLERAGKALHWKYPGEMPHLEPPQRIRRALEEMGPTFIKLGQILATRTDLFQPEWIREFEKLQDQAPALPFEALEQQLIEDLGAPADEIFPELEKKPLAAASIAQVHRARLDDTTLVVVKIRRPGIEQIIEADLRLLERLARILESEIAELRRYRPLEIVHQFTLSMRRELDLAVECRNAERIAANFKDKPEIIVPKVYWERVSERVNVQQFIQGIAGRDQRAIDAAGLNRSLLATRGADAVLQMVLIDGLFHADPHPGNIIYLPDNRIAFIDFGMVGRLSESRRDEVIDLLHSVVNRDCAGVVDVLLEWSGEAYIDTTILSTEVDLFIDTYHGVPLKALNMASMLADLTTLMREHQLALPPDLTLLFKALITLEGMGRQLDPDFDMISTAAPFLERAMLARYRPDILAKRGLRQFAGILDIVTGMPQDLRRLVKSLRGGALKINVGVTELNHFGWQLDRAASRLTIGMITSALIIGSSIVMTVSGGPTLFGLPVFGFLGFLGAGFGGVWLMLSIWRGKHDRGN